LKIKIINYPLRFPPLGAELLFPPLFWLELFDLISFRGISLREGVLLGASLLVGVFLGDSFERVGSVLTGAGASLLVGVFLGVSLVRVGSDLTGVGDSLLVGVFLGVSLVLVGVSTLTGLLFSLAGVLTSLT
jgi:hypothetical protein